MYQPTFEAMPRETLVKHQIEKLHNTLRHIHNNNARYANHLQGLGAEDVRNLEDIQQFPFMDKDTLRDAYPFGMACAPQSEYMRMHMSSGTTGTPVINPHTPQDVQQWADIAARCLTAAGVGRDDVLQITPSFGLFNGGFGFHYGATALETMIIPIGAGRTRLQLQFMRDLGTTAVAAIASYPLRLIEVAAEEGFDFRTETNLRVGIFGAEIWSDEMRQRIESQMGIEAFDIIGMTETGGVGMGIDCPDHSGVHVWEDHYLLELIDPNGDEPVPDGAWGEMVVTTLTRQGLPLIRFRTKDISRVLSREKCACGRTAMRIDRIAYRNDDMLVVKGVNFYPKQVESILLRHPEVALDYLIEIDRIKGADTLTIRVETVHDTDHGLYERLDRSIFNLLGLHATVILQPIGSLPRPAGKAVRVKDGRNHGA
ncbi:MAG: phenylacetate--CoA ligase [Chloroflexi bacterium]|nr:phenylacetate--CoA ligase [Chloroflexota bacterium]